MSLSEPRVSIVILNWSSYEVTLGCLLSLRKMDYRSLKLMAGSASIAPTYWLAALDQEGLDSLVSATGSTRNNI